MILWRLTLAYLTGAHDSGEDPQAIIHGNVPAYLEAFGKKEETVVTWKIECIHAAPYIEFVLHGGKGERPLINNSDKVRGFRVALPWARFAPCSFTVLAVAAGEARLQSPSLHPGD